MTSSISVCTLGGHFVSLSRINMPICGIFGCSNRPGVNKNLSFFKVPKIICDQGPEAKSLSEERRRLWKAAINRKDIVSEDKWERTIVCSVHFVGGKKAYLHDRSNPAWLPTLCLGPDSSNITEANAINRYERALKRRYSSGDDSTVVKSKKDDASLTHTDDIIPEIINSGATNTDLHVSLCEEARSEFKDVEIQTRLTSEDIQRLESDLHSRIIESSTEVEHNVYTFSFYEKKPDMVSFYTGLPNIDVLKLVYNFIEEYLPNGSNKCLSKECTFLICLVKMRMNYLFGDIANQLNVSISTVQRCFHSALDVLFIRLRVFIKWPERENLQKSMPMCFRENFGKKVVVILDCFELFTERPSSALNKVFTYSNYKHHQTVKYLIGIAPQGVVTFISEGWGGRTSDKFITEKSGILENLLPGDIVMVDRGFNIEESVNFFQAELAIPAFTKGKKQLHPIDVEKTRKIASVRIHVERVIGHILRKFRIFEGIIPVEFIKLRVTETVPTIDKLVNVACALTNLCVSIVPFE